MDTLCFLKEDYRMTCITIVDDGKKKTSAIIADVEGLDNSVRVEFNGWYLRKELIEKINSEFLPPAKPTSRKFLLTQKANGDLKNMSVDVEKGEIIGITLRERLLMEIKYFRETGLHLDINGSVTICSGSLFHSGAVPGIFYKKTPYNHDAPMAICSEDGEYLSLDDGKDIIDIFPCQN